MSVIHHLLPDNDFVIYWYPNKQIKEIMSPFMNGNSIYIQKWVRIPRYNLEMRLRIHGDTPYLLFRRNKTWVYTSILDFEAKPAQTAIFTLLAFYKKHGLGEPARPCCKNWVHSFPVNRAKFSDSELMLIHEIILFVSHAIQNILRLNDESIYPPSNSPMRTNAFNRHAPGPEPN